MECKAVEPNPNPAPTAEQRRGMGARFFGLIGMGSRLAIAPAIAVVAGAAIGNIGDFAAVRWAFFATVLAVAIAICAIATRKPNCLSSGQRAIYYLYVAGVVILAPVLFDHYTWSAFWGVPWVVPILCWLVVFLRKGDWFCACGAWLLLCAITIALVNNAYCETSFVGLWWSQVVRF